MEQLGYIGLGTIGFHMARHLVAAGYPVTLADRKPKDAVQQLLGGGAV